MENKTCLGWAISRNDKNARRIFQFTWNNEFAERFLNHKEKENGIKRHCGDLGEGRTI